MSEIKQSTSTRKIAEKIPDAVEQIHGAPDTELTRRARISHKNAAGKPGTRDRWYTSDGEIDNMKHAGIVRTAARMAASDGSVPAPSKLVTLTGRDGRNMLHPSGRAMLEALQDRRQDLTVSYPNQPAEKYIAQHGLEGLKPEIAATKEEHFKNVQRFLAYDLNVTLDQVRDGTVDFSDTRSGSDTDGDWWQDFSYSQSPEVAEVRDANGKHVGTVFTFETVEVTEYSWLRLFMDADSKKFVGRYLESTA